MSVESRLKRIERATGGRGDLPPLVLFRDLDDEDLWHTDMWGHGEEPDRVYLSADLPALEARHSLTYVEYIQDWRADED